MRLSASDRLTLSRFDVEQIDVPRQLQLVENVRVDDGPGDRQRRRLRDVVDVAVVRVLKLRVLLGEEPRAELGGEPVSSLDADLVVFGQRRVLVKPFPQDAEADFARRHVFHQVQHVVVAEEVRGLERGSLEPLAEGVAVLERDAQKIAGAANGSWRRFERGETGRVGRRVREPGKCPPELVVLADFLPHRPHDVNHLPMSDPLAARALALFALGASQSPSSCRS